MTADEPTRRSDGPGRTDDPRNVDDAGEADEAGDADDHGVGEDHGVAGDATVRDGRVHTTNFRTGRCDTPSEAVVETVAAATDRDTLALRSLYDVIDPDALDRLFLSASGSSKSPTTGRVTFRYEGCEIAVHGNGDTVVRPLREDDS